MALNGYNARFGNRLTYYDTSIETDKPKTVFLPPLLEERGSGGEVQQPDWGPGGEVRQLQSPHGLQIMLKPQLPLLFLCLDQKILFFLSGQIGIDIKTHNIR